MSDAADSYAPPAPPSSRERGRPYAIGGLVCALVAVFFLPIVLGPVAAVLGVVALRRGDPLGRWVIAAGVLATAVGIVLGALVFTATRHARGLGPVPPTQAAVVVLARLR